MRTSYSFTPFQRRSSHSSLFFFSAAVVVLAMAGDVVMAGDPLPVVDVSSPSAPAFVDLEPCLGAGSGGLHAAQSGVYVTNALGTRSGLVILNVQEAKSADLHGDGSVGIADLLVLPASWGPCADCKLPGDCPPDLNDDCTVGVADLLASDGTQHRRTEQCHERTM